MKHILEKTDSFNCKHKITIIESEHEKDYNTVRIEIIEEYHEDHMPENEFLKSTYVFREKKELSKFIGVLLHVQSKMK